MRIITSPKRMIFAATNSVKRVLRGMGRLIHPTAWKVHSANFALREFQEARQEDFKDHSFAVCTHCLPGITIGSEKSLALFIPPLQEQPGFSLVHPGPPGAGLRELRPNGVLGSPHSPGPTPLSIPRTHMRAWRGTSTSATPPLMRRRAKCSSGSRRYRAAAARMADSPTPRKLAHDY